MFAGQLKDIKSNETQETGNTRPSINASLVWREVECDALEGEGIQDISLDCSSLAGSSAEGSCKIVALHRHGRQITACQIPLGSFGKSSEESSEKFENFPTFPRRSGDFEGESLAVSDTWLQRLRPRDASTTAATNNAAAATTATYTAPRNEFHRADGTIATATFEKPIALLGLRSDSIVQLGTTRGRVVQVRQKTGTKTLVPEGEIGKFSQGAEVLPGRLRSIGEHAIAKLDYEGTFVQLLPTQALKREGNLPKRGVISIESPEKITGLCATNDAMFLLAGGSKLIRINLPQNTEGVFKVLSS